MKRRNKSALMSLLAPHVRSEPNRYLTSDMCLSETDRLPHSTTGNCFDRIKSLSNEDSLHHLPASLHCPISIDMPTLKQCNSAQSLRSQCHNSSNNTTTTNFQRKHSLVVETNGSSTLLSKRAMKDHDWGWSSSNLRVDLPPEDSSSAAQSPIKRDSVTAADFLRRVKSSSRQHGQQHHRVSLPTNKPQLKQQRITTAAPPRLLVNDAPPSPKKLLNFNPNGSNRSGNVVDIKFAVQDTTTTNSNSPTVYKTWTCTFASSKRNDESDEDRVFINSKPPNGFLSSSPTIDSMRLDNLSSTGEGEHFPMQSPTMCWCGCDFKTGHHKQNTYFEDLNHAKKTTHTDIFQVTKASYTKIVKHMEHEARHKKALLHNDFITDLLVLKKTFQRVEQCPWYWGNISGPEAHHKLRKKPIGTFLLRDSSDARYIFSLSFVTKRGPTSIRILYKHSRFFLDSEKEEMRNSVQQLPRSNSHPALDSCVLGMILKYTGCLQRTNNTNSNTIINDHHYINEVHHKNSTLSLSSDNNLKPTQKGFSCYWFDKGQRQEITVHLITPLNQSHQKLKGSIQSLTSLCRSRINASARTWELSDEQIEHLPVKENMREFLKNYPYPL